MIISGKVPSRITYVVRPEVTVTRGWEGLAEVVMAEPVKVKPAFAIDADSKTALETARRWGGKHCVEKTLPNDHIPAVGIVTLEIRQEGGRAYKVAIQPSGLGETVYVDLREDVLLDCLLHQGVRSGGWITGPFVWGRLNSQLRLVRVGSSLYDAMKDAEARQNTKTIGPKDWVVGGVYLDRKEEKRVYLGRVDSDEIERHETRHGIYPRYTEEKLTQKKMRDSHLWLELNYFGQAFDLGQTPKRTPQEQWDKGIMKKEPAIWGFKLIKKPVLIKHTETIDLGPEPLALVRKAALRYVTASLERHTGQDTPSQSTRDYTLCYVSMCAHLRRPGDPMPQHPEFAHLWKRLESSQ
jgi:hypothetical protein